MLTFRLRNWWRSDPDRPLNARLAAWLVVSAVVLVIWAAGFENPIELIKQL